MTRITPPATREELFARAAALSGASIADLATRLGLDVGGRGAHAKGKIGELLERALGATATSRAEPDFPNLGVELKTLPVDASGRVRESTFVSSFDVRVADTLEWETSSVRAKLGCVLWVPVIERSRIGRAFAWLPTAEELAALQADFDEIIGRLGRGEEVSARAGVHLQVRPKAADGTPTELLIDDDGTRRLTVRKGFYLRPSFTTALLRAHVAAALEAGASARPRSSDRHRDDEVSDPKGASDDVHGPDRRIAHGD